MELNLSKEDQASLFEMCTKFKIEPSDPIIGVLIELKNIKKEMFEKMAKERAEVSGLVNSLEGPVQVISGTLADQKTMLDLFQRMVNYVESKKVKTFVFGCILMALVACASYWAGSWVSTDHALSQVLLDSNSTLEASFDTSSQTINIKSKNIQKAVRNKDGVTVTFGKI